MQCEVSLTLMQSSGLNQMVQSIVSAILPGRKRNSLVFGESRIVVHDNSFDVIKHGETQASVPYDSVTLIFAHKRDLITTDLICFDIILSNGDMVEVNEEMIGFDEFLTAVERRFSAFDRQWADKVVDPPFVANRTCVLAAMTS